MSSLKSQVLAKCGELAPNNQNSIAVSAFQKVTNNGLGWVFELLDGEILFVVFENLDSNSPRWPSAAQILGVGVVERPSNELLRKAFGKGYASYLTPLNEAEIVFTEWLSTLPPDALEGDREIVKRNLKKVMDGEFDWVKMREHDDLFKAIQRLAGMEVGG